MADNADIILSEILRQGPPRVGKRRFEPLEILLKKRLRTTNRLGSGSITRIQLSESRLDHSQGYIGNLGLYKDYIGIMEITRKMKWKLLYMYIYIYTSVIRYNLCITICTGSN